MLKIHLQKLQRFTLRQLNNAFLVALTELQTAIVSFISAIVHSSGQLNLNADKFDTQIGFKLLRESPSDITKLIGYRASFLHSSSSE